MDVFSGEQGTNVLVMTECARSLEADRDHYKALCEELKGALLHVEQAYANRHSPQHRQAALDIARAALKKAQKP
jgi:hypothetical protein